LPDRVLKDFRELTGIAICEGYGLSEATCMSTCNPPTGLSKVGSIGVPVPGIEHALFDSEGAQVATGIGELGVRGPTIMQGYWNNDAATHQAIRDGWLLTGDLCTRDEDGYYFIVDRKKDMYIRGGYNIYPREVENVIASHPAVQEVAVVGIRHQTLGEQGKAFVVIRSSCEVTADELVEFCKARLAMYKVPELFAFVAALPKTATGKVVKRELIPEKRAG
jgi:long-chain acyl-CoA synthetase